MGNKTPNENEIVEILKNKLSKLLTVRSTATILGLATIGELQSNLIRIKTLACASLRFCNGKDKLSETEVSHLFNLLEKTGAARLENPAEDVFITNICSKERSYMVYENNDSTFFLERFIDIVDTMPNDTSPKKSIYSLLLLSNIVASKSEVNINTITGAFPLARISKKILLKDLDRRVKFTASDLEKNGYNISDIEPFILSKSHFRNVKIPTHNDELTYIDNYPVLDGGNGEFFLFPQGVSTAIRSHVISLLCRTEQGKDQMSKSLVMSYQSVLETSGLPGNIEVPPLIPFIKRNKNILECELSLNISKGRFLQLIFVFDCFYYNNFDNWTNTPTIIDNINICDRVDQIKNSVEKPELKDGITLLVFGGWGKPIVLKENMKRYINWSICPISFQDLCHMSNLPNIDCFKFWRIENAKRKLLSLGAVIQNINGPLNIIGWLNQNKGHIIPHEKLPQESIAPGIEILIPTNCIAKVRQVARRNKGQRVIRNINNIPQKVIRHGENTYFQEDQNKPLYACLNSAMEGKLVAVYVGKASSWWCSMISEDKNKFNYDIWNYFTFWLKHIDCSIQKVNTKMPKIVEWQLCVENYDFSIHFPFCSSRFIRKGVVKTTIRITPDNMFCKCDNSGEKAVVKSFLSKLLVKEKKSTLNSLIENIFPSPDAKYFHFFSMRELSDFFNFEKPILLDKIDDANQRLELGWLDTKNKFIKLETKEECINHLNQIVEKVWETISILLKKYEKTSLCEILSLNLESIQKEKTLWKRTVRANLALHQDKESVVQVINKEIAKLNAGSLGCRLLIEMANCTCSNNSTTHLDKLDISILQGYALLLFHLGSWSDAIRADLYTPKINVSSFGEIMLDTEFKNRVLNSFYNVFEIHQRKKDKENYNQLYQNYVDARFAKDVFEKDFLDAWENEFYLSIDNIRFIMDKLEDIAIKKNKAVFSIKRSLLEEKIYKEIKSTKKSIAGFLRRLSLPSRKSWIQQKKDLPKNIFPQDWYPWNYRRQLSLISRPFIQLDNNNDPQLLVNPGLMRRSIVYLISNSKNAHFDERNFHSKKMKKWTGSQRAKLGNDFNKQVASKMTSIGWEAESDIRITKILKTKTELDFGDVDVLAWSEHHKIVVAIECKSLFFAKTHKEIGNQINEFIGKKDQKGKRDRLLRHFDRLKTLSSNLSAVSKYTGIKNLNKIYGAVIFSEKHITEYAPQIPRERIFFGSIDSLESNRFIESLVEWKSNEL